DSGKKYIQPKTRDICLGNLFTMGLGVNSKPINRMINFHISPNERLSITWFIRTYACCQDLLSTLPMNTFVGTTNYALSQRFCLDFRRKFFGKDCGQYFLGFTI